MAAHILDHTVPLRPHWSFFNAYSSVYKLSQLKPLNASFWSLCCCDLIMQSSLDSWKQVDVLDQLRSTRHSHSRQRENQSPASPNLSFFRRVTLDDGSQWLIHKGGGFGLSSQTVVTDARHMSSAWRPVSSREFQGSKTVSDFVSAGGPNYNLLSDNCHLGSRRMMDQ